ncbi:GNAT family N-acetyltransferase [Deinococcus roseus]|uniref:N-acetyltransferase domain-containing protein n=1 Tax=Deinococcus roseus TaxID=392414 RepID=A0ABQ2D7D4_9DEIO|nr:GNAT family N-acetyltransferase [Deinococcus roseus]GGJ48314.1 hypothetical protein GCM10008938_37900 [Deinococcus roseus]
MNLSPFTPEWLPAAANLLSDLHQIPAEKLLPELEQLHGKSGLLPAVMASENQKLLGFLLGVPSVGSPQGRSVRVPLLGLAVVSDQPELLGDLYAAAGETWVSKGFFVHQVVVPAHQTEALQTLFALGFGQEQVHAGQDLNPLVGKASARVRRAGPEDLQALSHLIPAIGQHYVQGPVFEPFYPEQTAELLEGYAEVLQDPEWLLWVHEEAGEILAFQLYAPVQSDWNTPEGTFELKTAATLPAARGQGLQRGLFQHAVHHLQDLGGQRVIADWRSTNLHSARAWKRLAFEPDAYRLSRRLPLDLGWARGELSGS